MTFTREELVTMQYIISKDKYDFWRKLAKVNMKMESRLLRIYASILEKLSRMH